MSVINNVIETARSYSKTFGAFSIVFKDGSVMTFKTPEECKTGIETLCYMKGHPEEARPISTIRIPEEGGTYYWMKDPVRRAQVESSF